MAGIRLPPEESDVSQAQQTRAAPAATDLVSDDDRSVAADSWSIKSEYGSTLDDDQRHADAADALSAGNHRDASDYRFALMSSAVALFVFRESLSLKAIVLKNKTVIASIWLEC